MNADKIAILIDSCADVPAEIAKQHPIYTVPCTITIGEESYQSGVTIFPEDIYRRQVNETVKTSLPSGAVIADAIAQMKADGYNKAIAIMISSGVSGTYQMVRMMAEDETDIEMKVYDSLSGSVGQGAMVLTVARWIEEGRSWEQILDMMPRMIKQVYPYFSLDTLEYLKRGGRIGKISAMAGTALGIKPILSFDAETGELYSVYKVRGHAASVKKLVQTALHHIDPQKRYNIIWAHGNALEEGQHIAEMLREAAPNFVQEISGEIDCTLASYVGPHLLGAAIQVLDDDM